jgi:hypothetical protein
VTSASSRCASARRASRTSTSSRSRSASASEPVAGSRCASQMRTAHAGTLGSTQGYQPRYCATSSRPVC